MTGEVIAVRELLHPHEDEQPFTRSLSGIALPVGTTEVVVRSRCIVDGWSDSAVTITLP